MSGRSDRQVAALAEGIEEAMRLKGRRAVNVEGRQGARWILIDFADVVVHVFQEEVRSLYDLEGLFDDARRLPVEM
jgi:ribosome-associated protein